MSPAFEAFLARLYVDPDVRRRFLADPRAAAAAAGLSDAERDALAHIDREGLELAAESLARKREHAAAHARRPSLRARLARLLPYRRGAVWSRPVWPPVRPARRRSLDERGQAPRLLALRYPKT